MNKEKILKFAGFERIHETWYSPDGCYYGVDTPAIDLDFLFEYCVPKVHWYYASYEEVTKTHTVILFMNEDNYTSGIAGSLTEALCQAIENHKEERNEFDRLGVKTN